MSPNSDMTGKREKVTTVWLDCDPGHDDAMAIIMASFSPEIRLLGISIVHGNDTVEHCLLNAKRILWAAGINKKIPIYPGVNRPYVLKPKYCPEIHGFAGEDGVAGMCGYHFPDNKIFSNEFEILANNKCTNGVVGMATKILAQEDKVTVVTTGAHTNIAMAIRLFPALQEKIERVVFMGGAIGLGNNGVAAEFNIQIDPESTHVLLHSGIPLVMVPLEVTHSILITNEILQKIATIKDYSESEELTLGIRPRTEQNHPNIEYSEIFQRIENIFKLEENSKPVKEEEIECLTEFSRCLTKLLTFLASAYSAMFSFQNPPLHDPCAVFYLLDPGAFATRHVYVDVELSSNEKCAGRTLCDIHGLTGHSPNVTLCYAIQQKRFWKRMLSCLQAADAKSPLNHN